MRGKREELLEVAIDLFAANGYAGTSIRDIAQVVGKSVSNVYHHFESKEDLWLAILEHSVEGMPDQLRAVAHAEGPPLERFKEMVRAHMRAGTRHRREWKIFFIDEERLSPKGKVINRRVQKEILDIYVEQLRLLRSHGLVQTRHLTILAFNILATLNWYLRWYHPGGELSEEAVHEEVLGFILDGMRGGPGADAAGAGKPDAGA